MVDGATAAPEAPLRRARQSREHERLGIARRVGDRTLESEAGGDRGRERTAGAVIVRRRDSRRVKEHHGVGTHQDVRRVSIFERRLGEMTTLYEDETRAVGEQR